MPRKVRIPQSPPRIGQNSRRATTFDPGVELLVVFALVRRLGFCEASWALLGWGAKKKDKKAHASADYIGVDNE